MSPKKVKSVRHAEMATRNKDLNQFLRENKKAKDEALVWIDCAVGSALIKSNRTVLDVSNVDGVLTLVYHGLAHLQKGDVIKALVDASEEIPERPEFDDDKKIWKKPSGEVHVVSRSFEETERALEIKKLNGEGVVLCHYDGSRDLD